MIKASFKLFTIKGDELMDASVSGDSIVSALSAVNKKIKAARNVARNAGERDPLRNWNGIELFLNKFPGKAPKQETPPDAK